MESFLFSLLGLSFLGVFVDVIVNKGSFGVDFIFEIIALLIVVVNIIQLLNGIKLI